MPIPDFAAAGRILEDQIKTHFYSPGRWLQGLEKPPCSASTLVGVCSGHYNQGMGCTLDMLWRVCLDLCEKDTVSAQALVLSYLIEAKMVPPESTMLVHTDLARCEAQLRRARSALEKLARKRYKVEAVAGDGNGDAPKP